MADRPDGRPHLSKRQLRRAGFISINVGYRGHFLEVTVTCDRYDGAG